jgi:hypothetical protein
MRKPDCFIVAEARHNAPVKDFESRAFGPDRRVGATERESGASRGFLWASGHF